MKYKYQLHMHSSPCSKCAHISIGDLVRGLHKAGYTGGVITNHFSFGNTGIDRTLSWKDFAGAYVEDYLAGKKIAEMYDFDLIFGVEEHIGEGMEILPYGLTPELLLEHSELFQANFETWVRLMHKNNCLVIQAHPFRDASYIPAPHFLDITKLDGYEIFNHGNKPEINAEAVRRLSEFPNAILTSGGDVHGENGLTHGGIETDVRIQNEKELVSLLRSGKYRLITE